MVFAGLFTAEPARGVTMTKKPIDILLDKIDWQPLPKQDCADSNKPYATHEGVLHIGAISLRVYVLNDGRRIINAEDLTKFFQELL